MPSIKVYKHDGKAIPVDRAKIAKGYECPWTGKIYLSKKSYLQHLKAIREGRIRKILRNKRLNDAMADFNNQPNFESIIKWIETNSWFFLANAKRHYSWGDAQWPLPEDFWIKIRCLDLRWSNCVSNSHSCPRNGVFNWRRHDDLPKGYPGWEGWIEYELSEDLPSFGSEVFKDTGVHTGTGGARGKYRYGYEARFYSSDWPGLDKQQVLAILSEKENVPFKYGERR